MPTTCLIPYSKNRPFTDILTAGELALQFPRGQEICGYLFFPPTLARSFSPFRFPAAKPPNPYAIFANEQQIIPIANLTN